MPRKRVVVVGFFSTTTTLLRQLRRAGTTSTTLGNGMPRNLGSGLRQLRNLHRRSSSRRTTGGRNTRSCRSDRRLVAFPIHVQIEGGAGLDCSRRLPFRFFPISDATCLVPLLTCLCPFLCRAVPSPSPPQHLPPTTHHSLPGHSPVPGWPRRLARLGGVSRKRQGRGPVATRAPVLRPNRLCPLVAARPGQRSCPGHPGMALSAAAEPALHGQSHSALDSDAVVFV